MEFGCSPDIELPLANCSIGAGQEFPECCTRYQQKIFALKKETENETVTGIYQGVIWQIVAKQPKII